MKWFTQSHECSRVMMGRTEHHRWRPHVNSMTYFNGIFWVWVWKKEMSKRDTAHKFCKRPGAGLMSLSKLISAMWQLVYAMLTREEARKGNRSYSIHPYVSWDFYCYGNTLWPKAPWERYSLLRLTISYHKISLKSVQKFRKDRNLETGTDTEALKECCYWLAHLGLLGLPCYKTSEH